jgi:hypothetical protein
VGSGENVAVDEESVGCRRGGRGRLREGGGSEEEGEVRLHGWSLDDSASGRTKARMNHRGHRETESTPGLLLLVNLSVRSLFLCVLCDSLLFCLAGEVGGVEEREENAAEGRVAASGVVPLLQGVDAAAETSGADGDCGDAEGERDIGVG